MGTVIPQHHGGIRHALDAAADRALTHPGDLIAAALLAAVALTCLGYTLGYTLGKD